MKILKYFSGLQTFSKPFKIYLSKHVVENFINNMIEESEHCSNVMKEHFDKQLVILKKAMKSLRTLLNFGSVTLIMLIIMLEEKIILENVDIMHTETVIAI